MTLGDAIFWFVALIFAGAVAKAVGKLMFPFNRNDALKVVDHGTTWWRHWRAKELQQFNKKGPIVKVGARSFQILHERSDESDKMFPRPGLNGHVLVQERLRSRFCNGFLNRGTATSDQFQGAIDSHIANQSGWLTFAKAQPVAEDVESVVEHADIYRLYYVSLHEDKQGTDQDPE